MNTSNDSLDDDQDPEYEASIPNDETKQKAFEESARATTAKKIVDIIEKEFSKEIDLKEKEVLQIQSRLDEGLRTLQFLRYAVVTDFYNQKQCRSLKVSDSKQTRIHPAVKKLIGKCPQPRKTNFIDIAIPSTSTDPRFLVPETPSTSSAVSEEINKNATSQTNPKEKSAKRSHCESSSKEPPKKIPRYVPPKSAIPEAPGPSRGHRNKIRKRIIVGNISKWIPPDWREDKTSHKWTVYVRGSKEEADIGDFVAKVRFFLDPSYRPNDVVEVSSAPFHLSRRGWGEFPLRVQLHFKSALNKPIDIIHPLKLDRTFTGLQTLGSETVVDIWLQINEPRLVTPSISDASENRRIKEEPVDDSTAEIPSQKLESTIPNLNTELNITIKHESPEDVSHSKCYALIDHDYCKLPSNRLVKENEAHLPNGSVESELQSSDKSPVKNLPNGVPGLLALDSSLNKSKVQKLANSFKNTPGKMQLLKISIPEAFESSSKKQILVLKNKDLIPVNFDPKSKALMNPGTIDKKVNNLNNRKDVNVGKVVGKISEKSKLIKINPANSILLTGNYSEPALKFADPAIARHIQGNKTLQNLELHACSNSVESEVDSKIISGSGKSRIVLGKLKAKMLSNREIYEGIMRSIDDVRLNDTLSLVKYIINRLPLVTEKAADSEYKKLFPFTCKSREEFLSYNVGKQRAFEWQRAKTVRALLKRKTPAIELWSIKEIIIWSRRHAYTPISSISNVENISVENLMKHPSSEETVVSSYTKPVDLHKWLSESNKNTQKNNCDESDDEIDIIADVKPNDQKVLNEPKSEDAVFLELPPESESLFVFVNETARNIGVKLADEEVIPEVRHCAASHMIVRAMECFVENLVRLSHATALDKNENKNSCVESIHLEDVRQALFRREEFDLFTNAGLGSMSVGEE